jgi:hypothetical protein
MFRKIVARSKKMKYNASQIDILLTSDQIPTLLSLNARYSRLSRNPLQRKLGGFFHFQPYLAMRSTALPSHQYGDPASVLEAKQAREKRQAQQEPKRPVLTLKRKSGEWSEARKRAEALFATPD